MVHNGIHAGTIEKFAKILYEHKYANKLPVVLVGAGISIESGGPSGSSLMESVLNDYRPSDEDWAEHKEYLIGEKLDAKILGNLISKLKKGNKISRSVYQEENGEKEQFEKIYQKLITSLYNSTISQRSLQEIYGAFHRYLLYHQPSKGYKYFSYIAKKGYIEWILSTNFDPLLEEALLVAGLPSNNFIQFTRQFTDPLELSNFIESRFSMPQVKLFKIHGDLKTRRIDATGETIKEFKEGDEKLLEKSLIKLIQERDLIVIGHSLNDGAINDIIRGAYKENDEVRRRLNSIWLLTMKKDVAIGHILNELSGKHDEQKNSAINFLEKSNPKSHSEIISSYTFDECMEKLYNEILKLENKFEYSNNKPLKDHTDIYHISGTTVNKKQLLHLVVAPQHYDETNYINSKNVLDEDPEFQKAVSPIYFSSLSDAITAQLLHEGLKRNRSNARVHQIMSDFPQVKMPFVRDVFIQNNTKYKEISLKDRKGVRALSEYLYNFDPNSVVFSWEKIPGNDNKNLIDFLNSHFAIECMNTPEIEKIDGGKTIDISTGKNHLSLSLNDEKTKVNLKIDGVQTCEFIAKNTKNDGLDIYTKPIKIFLDSSMNSETESFFENQNYREMAESDDKTSVFNILLHTMVILAGSKNKTEVVNTEDDADICISLKETLNSIKIPIYRFIPVATPNTNIYEMISKPKMDTHNLVLLTVGGPEHNKLLELFIALHRWQGGETVFNYSNYFDRAASEEIQSGLTLFNEAYVGGIAVRGTNQDDIEEKNRTGKGAFIASFSIPTCIPWSETEVSPSDIKIVSTVGMSAVGTTLGIAYVSFNEKFLVGADQITFIDIPNNLENLGVKNVNVDQKNFIMNYIKYLQNKPNSFAMLPGELYIETLLNPIEKKIYESMKTVDIEFDELKGYESHAKLWSLIAERYLIKRY